MDDDTLTQPLVYDIYKVVDPHGIPVFQTTSTRDGFFDALTIVKKQTQPHYKLVRTSDGKTLAYTTAQRVDMHDYFHED